MARNNADVSNNDDVIDSRDVIARIEELSDERDALQDEIDGASEESLPAMQAALDVWNAENAEELSAFESLASEAEGYASDWKHGETLVRESYFTEYAQQLAEDIGAIPDNAQWPCTCIDWEQAASELRMDYTAVDFNGVTYYVR